MSARTTGSYRSISFTEKLQRLRTINSFADVLVLTQVILLWCVLPLLLLLPLERVLKILTPSTQSLSHHRSPQKILQLAGYWFHRRPVSFFTRCLTRSLILYYVMNRYGAPVTFYLGIKKGEEQLTGHSWLQNQTDPFSEDPLTQNFTVIFTYPKEEHL